MMLFEFLPLRIEELVDLQYEVLRDNKKGLGGLPLLLEKNVAYALAKQSQGDARQCLQLLEGAALISPYNSEGKIVISEEILKELAQRNQKPARDQKGIRYDRMSSFIKSMRAGDKEGALSCLALLLDEGENLDFILRRLLIFASEDIGLADPQALPLVLAAAQTVERIGLPEARITLTHAVLYLCLAPKNREAYNFSKN